LVVKTKFSCFFPSFMQLHFVFLSFSFLFMGFFSRCFRSGCCKYFVHARFKFTFVYGVWLPGGSSILEIWPHICQAWPAPPYPHFRNAPQPMSRFQLFFWLQPSFSYYKTWDGTTITTRVKYVDGRAIGLRAIGLKRVLFCFLQFCAIPVLYLAPPALYNFFNIIPYLNIRYIFLCVLTPTLYQTKMSFVALYEDPSCFYIIYMVKSDVEGFTEIRVLI
jgi:hypothetical protein